MIHLIGSVLTVTCAVMAIVFCILYHIHAAWWRSEEGRHLMSFTASIAVILSLYSARVITGSDTGWFETARLIAFCSFPWVMGWRLWMLYKLQIRPGKGSR